MVVIDRIRISNGKQIFIKTKKREIRAGDLEKFRRRIAKLYNADVDFRYKLLIT